MRLIMINYNYKHIKIKSKILKPTISKVNNLAWPNKSIYRQKQKWAKISSKNTNMLSKKMLP